MAQKLRAFVVEGDRAADVVAYLMCYCLELRNESSMCSSLQPFEDLS